MKPPFKIVFTDWNLMRKICEVDSHAVPKEGNEVALIVEGKGIHVYTVHEIQWDYTVSLFAQTKLIISVK